MKKRDIREAIEHLLKDCPDVLTPKIVVKWSPLGKNTVYSILKNGDLPSLRYRGTYIIAKSDLIEYLAMHANDKPRTNLFIEEDETDE